jgi:hypothetical protein
MHSYGCGGIKMAFGLGMKERSMVEVAHAMTFAHKYTNTSICSAFNTLYIVPNTFQHSFAFPMVI